MVTKAKENNKQNLYKQPEALLNEINKFCKDRRLKETETGKSLKFKLLSFDKDCCQRPRMIIDGVECRPTAYVLNVANLEAYMKRLKLWQVIEAEQPAPEITGEIIMGFD